MIDEEPLLIRQLAILTKKYDLSKYEEKNKIIKALLSKGFDYNLIKKNVKGGTFYEKDE